MHGSGNGTPVVRMFTASAFATDRLTEAHGSPRQVFSSQRGVVHEFCDGKVELTEADVGTSGSRATVKSVARAIANLHCIPASHLPPGIPSTPMVWVSVDTNRPYILNFGNIARPIIDLTTDNTAGARARPGSTRWGNKKPDDETSSAYTPLKCCRAKC
jgi:hypothetical protein